MLIASLFFPSKTSAGVTSSMPMLKPRSPIILALSLARRFMTVTAEVGP